MSEQKPWAYAVKAREDSQLSSFLGLAQSVSNVLGFLGVACGIAAVVHLVFALSGVPQAAFWAMLVAGVSELLLAVLLFLLGAFVSASAEVLARCVVGVERPGAPEAEGS